MKLFLLIVLLHLVNYVSPNAPADQSPDSVVRELYQQVVARGPLGIPKGDDKAALRPFLGLRVIQKLGTAEACGDDYFGKVQTKIANRLLDGWRPGSSLGRMNGLYQLPRPWNA